MSETALIFDLTFVLREFQIKWHFSNQYVDRIHEIIVSKNFGISNLGIGISKKYELYLLY